ncbi:MAG: 16S rRNA (cytosine(1402)-N(4))-methyltransferase RsmH, partial [Candidatus Eremiobacteraeota bacterium]|nr:16S rRNA (cytosine(1402)-N(4))-methyltransferase RsmH [Candidatus Eremiobacteraeota bacterium]
GVLFDLGVSSMQLDDAERGFSFREAAPLDMRMNPNTGASAFDVLSSASEGELADIFFHYGEERAARRIAHAIVVRRNSGRLPTTTTEFAQMVSGIVHRPGKRERIHPATRVFQALRIAVNDELGALREGLSAAVDRMRGAGRIVTISFHSLEDRIVKQTFRDDERLNVLTKKPVVAGDEEMAANPRSRSAKLRAAERKVS